MTSATNPPAGRDNWHNRAVSASGGNEQAPDRVLVTDAERDQVVARLNDAIGRGALQLADVEERLGAVFQARTRAELASITSDLPEPEPEMPTLSPFAGFSSSSFQMHLVCYVVVIAFLTGIWALSGAGHFWPFYPAGGWGIGLAMHYLAATRMRHIQQRRRAQRRSRPQVRHDRHQARHQRRHLPAGSARELGRGRRFVVALFVDVVGSTSLNESLGDVAWARERERFRSLVARCAVLEKGWEVSAAGDGVLLRFESPAPAVRAAVAIQRQLAERRAEAFAPSVRIGIHSGDVVDEGDDIVGAVVNVASRVTDAAGADEILVTEHVADHADGAVTVDRGLRELKGVSRPRHLLAVEWNSGPESADFH